MQLHVIDTGYFKLDGGAMFGVVPKTIWQKLNPPDNNNLCTWAMRCLLVEDGDRLMLIDTGLGNKQSAKFFSYYEPHGEDSLDKSLAAKGFSVDDITDVLLTHLHFDHCGDAVRMIGDKLQPTFKNATYWSNEAHWIWAIEPNDREKASFLKENFVPIQENGQLQFIDEGDEPMPGVEIQLANGHTEAMIIPRIKYKDKTIIYGADLMPSHWHIPMPYVMAYDVRPLVTLEEKRPFLDEAEGNGHILFYEHDPSVECSSLIRTEKGVRCGEKMKLEDIL